jgi:hypothetical protein
VGREEEKRTQSAQRFRREEGIGTTVVVGESWKRTCGDSARGWALAGDLDEGRNNVSNLTLACGGDGYTEFLELGAG